MATNKIVQRTVEEFMSEYTPVYNPIYALFKSVTYAPEVGSVQFKQMSAVGDIRAHRILPKDTEIRQVNAGPGVAKAFHKYFFANQFTVSHLQDQQGTESIVAEVLDEHQKQFDELFLFGDGTAPNNVLNNGLFYSADPNYILNSAASISEGNDPQTALYNLFVSVAETANQIAGRKALIIYGTKMIGYMNSLVAVNASSFKGMVSEGLGSDYTIIKLNQSLTPSGQEGFLISNLDRTAIHYAKLPGLDDNGDNAEKKYSWWNFLMSSNMLEVSTKGAVIKQPVTFGALMSAGEEAEKGKAKYGPLGVDGGLIFGDKGDKDKEKEKSKTESKEKESEHKEAKGLSKFL